MGEQLTNIGVKVDADTLRRIDAEMDKWYPIEIARATIGAALIRAGLDAIETGIFTWPRAAMQGLREQKLVPQESGVTQVTPVIVVNPSPQVRGKRTA